MSMMIPSVINFSVLVSGLLYFAGPKLKSTLIDRHATTRDDLGSIQGRLKRAREELANADSTMGRMGDEVRALEQRAEADLSRQLEILRDGFTKLLLSLDRETETTLRALETDAATDLQTEFVESLLEEVHSELRTLGDAERRTITAKALRKIEA